MRHLMTLLMLTLTLGAVGLSVAVVQSSKASAGQKTVQHGQDFLGACTFCPSAEYNCDCNGN